MIVSDVAGTTRDAIDTPIEVEGRKLLLVDTAGIRRAAKVNESVEYYTTLRSQRAAERADVALVVCDAQDGVTSQDLRIADLAMQLRLRHRARAQQVGPDRRRRRSARPGRRHRRRRSSTASARGSTRSCACGPRC